MMPEHITMITALLTLAAAIIAVVRSFINMNKIDAGNKQQKEAIQEIHVSINSRLSEFIDEAKKAAWLGGRAEAHAEDKVPPK